MRKGLKKQFLSAMLTGALIFTSFAVPVEAAGDDSGTNGRTVAGEPETVQTGGENLGERDNNFNDGWKFYLGTSSAAQNPNFDDSGWESVTLPHDFSISQPYTTTGEAESGFLPGGTGWYRKTFVLPEEYKDKTVVLNFDGVYSDAYVYVNGTAVGENHYGYTSFAFDISDEITCDGKTENVIAVRAVNNIPSSRWYSGSGIYRDVTLTVTDPVHVEHYGTQITTPDIEEGKGTVAVKSGIANDSAEAADITVKTTVYTEDGKEASDTVETSVSIDAGSKETIETEAYVDSPALWSPDEPNLYYVRTEIVAGDRVTDTEDTVFGFRYMSFDSDKGFYLNGEAVKLNGVCLHNDQGALGSAAYYDAMYRQLSIMKDMGVNAIRTSHNPADEDLIDICNEMGLLVIEEAFDGWELPKNGNSNDFSRYFNTNLTASNNILGGDSSMTWSEFAIKSMVKRDRNDPSVILWSLGNEVQEGTNENSDFASVADKLISWVKEVDTTRQTTIGSNRRTTTGKYGDLHSAVKEAGGIVGFNYASAGELEAMHNTYGPIIASETSSAVNSRGIYTSQASATDADGKYHLTSYDTSTVSWGATAHDSMWNTLTRDYVAGEFVWTGFDYLGEPTPWNGTWAGSVTYQGAIPNSSYFGIAETTGFEKDTYYLYRSQWNQDSYTLHLVTAWDDENMMTNGDKTPVAVYSNAPVVKLYRDDKLIGTATRQVNRTEAGHIYYTYTAESNDTGICTASASSGADSLYAAFDVSYTPGTISAKAYEEDGKTEIKDITGRASVSTPGEAGRLAVSADKTEITADGSSLAYISVDVEDNSGDLDTTAGNTINFTLSGDGEIVGVDNGDQATTEKYQQPSVLTDSNSAKIKAYAGKALVIVRSTKDAGSFTLEASSSGLDSDSVTVTTTAAGDETDKEGLISYTMIRDYSVKEGTKPELSTEASGQLSNDSTVKGTVAWDEIPESVYGTAGDYIIKGILSFEDMDPIEVSCRLHVIPDVTALRNISAATTPDTVPSLPDTVKGVMEDGTLSGEFAVTWDKMESKQFAEIGKIVTVKGTAVILGDETMPVTASVRVAEAVNVESTNAAPAASSLTQDIAADMQSDNLASITNGITKPGDDTTERWTNWNNRSTSSQAALTFRWDTAQMLNSVNLYYYYDSCSAYPEDIRFEYSLNGTEYEEIQYTSECLETYSLGAAYAYTFEAPVNPVSLRITFTQQGGTSGSHCVGLTEAEIMTYAGELEYNSSAALTGISVDGKEVSGFNSDVYTYEAAGGEDSDVTAQSDVNAGITVLPYYDNSVQILTVSEDGTDTRAYEVKLKKAECSHKWDEGVVTKEPTVDAEGEMTYTCTICGETRTEPIPKVTETTKVPSVTLTAEPAKYGKIVLTGKYVEYSEADQYFPVTAWGMVYISTEKLGDRELTVDIPGRVRVNFGAIKADGSFIYKNMTPAYSSTEYCICAYLAYTDDSGKTVYTYSEPIITSYNELKS